MLRYVLFDVDLFPTEAERESSEKRILILLEALTMLNRVYLKQHPETPLIYQSGITYKLPAQFEKEEVPEVDFIRSFLQDMGASEKVMEAFRAVSDQLGCGEHFRDIPQIIKNGGGDCDNIAAWRVAELREKGVDAKPYITWKVRADGGYTYHVIVAWPDGSSEDPCLLLGMGGPDRDPDRQEELRKLRERTGEFLAGVLQKETGRRADVVLGKDPLKIYKLRQALKRALL